MNDIKFMASMFVVLIVLYAIGYLFILIRNNRISKKRDIYQNLLQRARATRKQYIKSLEMLDNAQRRLDRQLEELHTEKLRLQRTRAGLRELAAEIRTLQSAEKIDNVEANVIAQKKTLFAEHWKVLNNFRNKYIIFQQTCRVTKNEHHKHTELVSRYSQDWEEEKSALMTLYNQLKEYTPLSDPRMSLGTSK